MDIDVDISQKYLHIYIHCSSIHTHKKKQEMESSTYMPINRWMNNKNMLLYSIYLAINKIGIVKISENKQNELEIIMSKKLWETNTACPPLVKYCF